MQGFLEESSGVSPYTRAGRYTLLYKGLLLLFQEVEYTITRFKKGGKQTLASRKQVQIPAGIKSGEILRVDDEGDPFFVHVDVEEHEVRHLQRTKGSVARASEGKLMVRYAHAACVPTRLRPHIPGDSPGEAVCQHARPRTPQTKM